eukprot:1967376-Lingulodinium_polyedra.AAC.1
MLARLQGEHIACGHHQGHSAGETRGYRAWRELHNIGHFGRHARRVRGATHTISSCTGGKTGWPAEAH